MALDLGLAFKISSTVTGTDQVKNFSNEVNNAATASARTEEAGKRLVTQLEKEVDEFGKSRAELLQMRAAKLQVADAAGPLIQKLKDMEAAAKAERTELKALEAANNSGSDAAHKFSLSTTASRRELIVLAHELSQGNYSRFGGSMMVLAEQTNLLGVAMSAAGATVIAIVAAIGGATYAMIKGAAEAKAFANDMKLTGDYAGLTAGQFEALSLSVSRATNVTQGHARDALQALVGSGRASGDVLEAMGKAAVKMADNTGQSADDVVKDMVKMSDGVAKWAEEHNKSYHFLTAAQYDYIVKLEEQGRKEDAELVVAKALYNHLGGDAVQQLGNLGRAWDGLKKSISSAWEAMKDWGKPVTNESAIAQLEEKRKELSNPDGVFDIFGNKVNTKPQIEALDEQLRVLKQAEAQQQLRVQNKAKDDKVQERGVAARDYINQLGLELDKRKQLNHALDEYRQKVADERAAGLKVSDAEVARTEQQIRDKYKEKKAPGGAKLENAYQSQFNSLGEENAKLDAEIKQYERYGNAVDHARRAQIDFLISHNKLGALSPDKKATLQAMADSVDANQQKLETKKLSAEAEKRAKAIDAETAALNNGNKASKEAGELAQFQAKGLAETDKGYQHLKTSIEANNQAKEMENLQNWVDKHDLEIKAINDETAALGETALQLKITAEYRKIDNDLRQQMKGASPVMQASLKEEAERQKEATKAALEAQETYKRSPELGAQKAINDYLDTVTNAGQQMHNVVTSAFKGMEDVLVNFFTTGKGGWKDFATSVIKEIDRMIIEYEIMAPIANAYKSNGGIAGILGATIGSIGTQSPAPIVEGLSGGRADGGSVSAGSLYRVNERGPELLNVGGSQYLLMGNQSGSVTPNRGGAATGGNTNVVVHVNSDSGQLSVTGDQGKQLGNMIGVAVRQILINEKRQGGLLAGK